MSHNRAPLLYVGLDHVVLRCRDLEIMLNFYQQALGCLLERVNGDLHHLRAGNCLIDLIPQPHPTPANNLDHFCLRIETPDWDNIRTHLAGHGITTEPPQRRYGADGHGLSIYLADPEGNGLELKGPSTT